MKLLKILHQEYNNTFDFWIEGIPFEKETYFDQDLMIDLPTGNIFPNYICHENDLSHLTYDVYSLVGKHVCFDNNNRIQLQTT